LPAADLIHSLTAHPYAILAAVESRRQKIPFLIHDHGTFAVSPLHRRPDRWLLIYAYQQASAIIAPSEFTLQAIQKYASLPASTRTKKILNAVDYARFQSPDETIAKMLRRRFGSGPIILSIGALKARKGHDTLLHACALVQRIFPSLVCVIIGSGDQEQRLRQLAAQLSLNQIYFLRSVSDEELIAYYHLCDVFALTPRMINWQFEGFGLVYLEAGACGKPVVGTLSGGVPDAVIDEETGLLVPPDDPQATAEAILRILENPNLAARLGENGRHRASLLTWDWFAGEILEVYEEVLGYPCSCS
jgi:phosphatidylinositol alpha-1,6-mannosyltransferase